MQSDIGMRAAYERIVSAAFDVGASAARRIVADLTPEAKHEMLGMVAFDLDDCYRKEISPWPFEIVKRVLLEE